jgi:hypothetical protein
MIYMENINVRFEIGPSSAFYIIILFEKKVLKTLNLNFRIFNLTNSYFCKFEREAGLKFQVF